MTRTDLLLESRTLEPLPKEAELDTLVFSPDGRRHAYAMKSGDHQLVVESGSPGEHYPSVGIAIAKEENVIHYSGDSAHVAHVAGSTNDWRIIVDGIAGPSFPFARSLTLGHDGQTAFRTRVASGEEAMVRNNKQEPLSFERVGPPMFSPTGSVCYTAYHADRRLLMVDDKRIDTIEALGNPVFSSDGTHSARVGLAPGMKWFVVVDEGEPGIAYDGVEGLAISGDGKTVVYGARQGKSQGSWALVRNNVRQPQGFDLIRRVIIAHDGEAFAFSADRGDHTFVVDSSAESQAWAAVGPLALHGAHLAYAANIGGKRTKAGVLKGGKWHIVINGRAGEAFDQVFPPTFSADGSLVGYGARKGKNVMWKVDAVT